MSDPTRAHGDAPPAGESITCRRCGNPGTPPAPEKVTWGGELGDVITRELCTSCWDEWQDMSVKIVNEYRLSMANREHYALFVHQLRMFLGLAEPGSSPS